MFYRHTNKKITIVAVYVDDIIITGDDEEEIKRVKGCLSKEFEVKDLGNLKYFLGIEVARTEKGISLCQRKYTLDLLSDMGMMGCRAAPTPIEQNHQVTAQSGELVNKEDYQKLVGRLLYLCHTRPDITYAVGVVSRYMHEPRSGHLDIVHRILTYLKGLRVKGCGLRRVDILRWMAIVTLIGPVVKMIEDQLLATVCLWEEIWCHGEARNRMLCLDQQQKLNIEHYLKGYVRCSG